MHGSNLSTDRLKLSHLSRHRILEPIIDIANVESHRVERWWDEVDVSDEGLFIIRATALRLEVDGLRAPIVDFRQVASSYCWSQYRTSSCLKLGSLIVFKHLEKFTCLCSIMRM